MYGLYIYTSIYIKCLHDMMLIKKDESIYECLHDMMLIKKDEKPAYRVQT